MCVCARVCVVGLNGRGRFERGEEATNDVFSGVLEKRMKFIGVFCHFFSGVRKFCI